MNTDRTIVIGDVHGCLNELIGLVNKVGFTPGGSDRCIVVGDLVDRGPYSVDTVKWCKAHNIEVVIGNHDDKYVRYHEHELKKQDNPNYKNPMNFGFDKLGIYSGLVETGLIPWLAQLPSWIFLEEYNTYVVHAGLLPDNLSKLEFHPRKAHLYSRFFHEHTNKMLSLNSDHKQPNNSVHWTDLYNGNENIVYGHHTFSLDDPKIVTHQSNARTFGIDTGCCFGGNLTALILEGNSKDFEVKFVQVPAKKQYHHYK
jgi:bis(5'-nucleosyl)-tetraphosphatase (symmetrical)